MSDAPIAPALSAEEWREVAAGSWPDFLLLETATLLPVHLPRVIAVANAALPDGDPRKITREDVDGLRSDAREYETRSGCTADGKRLLALAAKLAALLPEAQ